jgi:hypothetical protein
MVGPAARDGVIEYLLSCDPEQQQAEMVAFLEQIGGKNPKFTAVVKQYALLEKNLNRGTLNAPASQQAVTGKQKKKNANGSSTSDVADNTPALPCTCMGSRHAVWGSCGSCGRIYCVNEQVRKCKYCSERVLPCMSAEEAETAGLSVSTVAAYRQKDKLMLFDSENAKRTQVHDAQSDYYKSNDWLTEEEKKENEKKEKERYDQKFNRKSTFRISIDVSGR